MSSQVIKLRRSAAKPGTQVADQTFETSELPSQRRQAELGRFLLQIDRQTKGSYDTAEAVEALARSIKEKYPAVTVSVYDTVECQKTNMELESGPY